MQTDRSSIVFWKMPEPTPSDEEKVERFITLLNALRAKNLAVADLDGWDGDPNNVVLHDSQGNPLTVVGGGDGNRIRVLELPDDRKVTVRDQNPLNPRILWQGKVTPDNIFSHRGTDQTFGVEKICLAAGRDFYGYAPVAPKDP